MHFKLKFWVGFYGALLSIGFFYEEVQASYGPDAHRPEAELAAMAHYLEPKLPQSQAALAAVYLAQNKLDQAYLLALPLKNTARPEDWMPILGEIWYLQGAYGTVLDQLVIEQESLASTPWVQEVFLLRAKALLAQGKIEPAWVYLDRLKSQAPFFARGWLGRAKAYGLSLNFESAEEALLEAQKAGALLSDLALVQGDLYRLQSDLISAQESYERALRADSGNLEARLHLTSLQLNAPNLDHFYQNTQILYQVLPQNPEVQLFQAITWVQKNQLAEAQPLLEELTRLHPNMTAAALLLSRLYFTQGQYEQASKQATQVLAKRPEDIQARTLLAAIALKFHRPAQAIELISPYVSEVTEDPRLLALLGTAYLLQRETDKGLHYLSQATEFSVAQAKEIPQNTTKALYTHSEGLDFKVPDSDLNQEVLTFLAALEQKQWSEAERLAAHYLQRYGETGLSTYLLGLVKEAKQEWESALTYYRSALRFDPKLSQARYRMVEIQLKTGRKAEAKALLTDMSQRMPKDLHTQLQWARLEEQEGDWGLAIKRLQEAQAQHPKQSEPGQALVGLYQRMQQPEKALGAARVLSKNFPEQLSLLRLHAQLSLETHQSREALQLLTLLNNQSPNDQGILYALAQAQSQQGHWNAAQETLTHVLSLNPHHVEAQTSKMSLFVQQQDYEAALSLAEKLEAYEIMGDAYLGKKELSKAALAYEKAYQQKPSANLAKSLYHVYQAVGQVPQSLSALESWTQQHPEDLKALKFLGAAYLALGNAPRATQLYEQILKQSQQDVIALNNLALIKVQETPGVALDLAKQAYQLSPDQPKVADTYGYVLLQNGQRSEALKILEKASAQAPHDLEIQQHIQQARSQ